MSMVHIESRKSKRRNSEVEIFVDCDCSKKEFNELIQLLKFQTNIVSLNPPENIWTDEEGKAAFVSLDLGADKRLCTGVSIVLCSSTFNSHSVFYRSRLCPLVPQEDI